MQSAEHHTIEQLRQKIAGMSHAQMHAESHLPFGVGAIDDHLPAHGLPLGSLNEFSGADGINDEAAATLFIAGILSRLTGPVVWCFKDADLFAPSLPEVGLDPARIIFVEGRDEKTVLMVVEESLRHAGLAGVVGEIKSLSMTSSRRLHLAARTTGVTAFVLLRKRQSTKEETTAANTRWNISCLPSVPLPTRGVGRAQWLVELTRCRDGEPAQWVMEACDAKGYLSLPSHMADRSLPEAERRFLSA